MWTKRFSCSDSAPRPGNEHDPYPWLASLYDPLAALLLLPFGGEARVRGASIEALQVRAGMRVLELGCGSGAMTAELTRRGAAVVGVDRSAPMLRRARRRAPRATIVCEDFLRCNPPGAPFDRVLIAFVLHELDRSSRQLAIAAAARALSPSGLLGVLDYAAADRRWLDALLGVWLRVAEPATARDWIARGCEAELSHAGLRVHQRVRLAGGTAEMVVARR